VHGLRDRGIGIVTGGFVERQLPTTRVSGGVVVTVSQALNAPAINARTEQNAPQRRLETGVPDISGIRPAQAPIVLALCTL